MGTCRPKQFVQFTWEKIRKVKFLLGIEQDSWMIGSELGQRLLSVRTIRWVMTQNRLPDDCWKTVDQRAAKARQSNLSVTRTIGRGTGKPLFGHVFKPD